MALYELAFQLGITVSHLQSLPYEEILGWHAYFRRRPYGFLEDRRAAVLLKAFAGSNVKEQEIFPSLKQLQQQEAAAKQRQQTIASQFFQRFSHRMTNKEALKEINA